MPPGSTPIVEPPASSAPRCASRSMPSAMPLTTVNPRDARSCPIRRAISADFGSDFRVPTIATERRTTVSPTAYKTSGGLGISLRSDGYSRSQYVRIRAGDCSTLSIICRAASRGVPGYTARQCTIVSGSERLSIIRYISPGIRAAIWPHTPLPAGDETSDSAIA